MPTEPKTLRTEEDVKIKYLLPLLKELGYTEACFEFERGIEIQEGRKRKTIYPDIIVYTDAKKKSPLIVCEVKGPNEVLTKFVKEQAISYARLLPVIAPLALITNGFEVRVFQTLHKNRLPSLPQRKELHVDIVNFVVGRDIQDALRAEAKHELFIIDDVTTFKSVLKRCHNEIRNNEGYDPTVAFDEMSKVMFCKLYEEKEHPANNRFRLAIFDETLENLGINVIRQIFNETKTNKRYSGLFDPGSEIHLHDRTIRKIVELFENYDLSLTAFDVKGEAFEYFLGDTFTGGLGEYFTPRNIVEFIVDAIDPKIGQKIVDPFCGTGGFLIYAFEVVGEKIRLNDFDEDEKEKWRIELSNRSLYGTDWKERTSQACKMNMMVHGDGSAGIFMHHGLTDVAGVIEENLFHLCLTNPPFGSHETDKEILGSYEFGSGRNSQDRLILAIERSIRLVKPGGLVGIVVIDGVLNNRTTAYVREYIKSHTTILGIVSLAKETFEAYGARAKTTILFLRKKEAPDDGEQPPVFMSIAGNTGYAKNGALIPGNELPDILIDFKEFIHSQTTSSQHANSWIINKIGERLDAEYYVPADGNDNSADIPYLMESSHQKLFRVNDRQKDLYSRIDEAKNIEKFEAVRLGDVLTEVTKKELIASDRTYKLIGVRWWGEGAFIREEKLGSQIKASSLNKVSVGRLIYNRLFAFRGSFALLRDEHDGCYVSNEFPTYQTKDASTENQFLLRYIVHCLNTPQYLRTVDKLSTGSTRTSRNRFNQRQFEDLMVSVPSNPANIEKFVGLFDEAYTLRQQQQELLESITSLRDGLGSMLPQPAS